MSKHRSSSRAPQPVQTVPRIPLEKLPYKIYGKYGAIWEPTLNQEGVLIPMPVWQIEWEMCRNAPDGLLPPLQRPLKGHLGFKEHFKRLRRAWFGDPNGFWHYADNPNEDLMLDRFLKYRRLGLMGCASSGKSRFMVCTVIMLFMIYDRKFTGLCTSTTLKSSSGKFWGEIENAWQRLIEFFGNEELLPGALNRSELSIKYACNGQTDTTAGIRLFAVEKGKEEAAAKKIQGTKNRVLLVCADELDTLQPALMATVNSNLSANEDDANGQRHSYFIGSFNPTAKHSVGGNFVTPIGGRWNTITEEGPYEWELDQGGVCLRFTGERSPNIVDTDGNSLPLALANRYPGLLTTAAIERIKLTSGGANTVGYYSHVKAWFCPIGLRDTVCNDQEIYASEANLMEFDWIGKPSLCGGFDPANTVLGDGIVLCIGKVGKVRRMANDKQVTITSACLVELIHFRLAVRSSKTPEQQVTDKLQEILNEERWKNPTDCDGPLRIENIGTDITGGSPVVALVKSQIGVPLEVHFKGKARERKAYPTDKDDADVVYANKRAEMYDLRPLIRTQQLRGIKTEIIHQLCETEWVRPEDLHGTKLKQVEDKDKIKERLKKSPDEADSYVLFIETAKARFGLQSEEKIKIPLKPGHTLITGMQFDPSVQGLYREVSMQVPILSTTERQERERWMTPAEKKVFHRNFGPPPMEQMDQDTFMDFGRALAEESIW